MLRPTVGCEVHVPNGPALMEAFVERPVEEKWPIMGSILGMYCSPDVRDPRDLDLRSDHQLIFDSPLMAWALDSGRLRGRCSDLTGLEHDRHTEAWAPSVPDYSLIVEARR